MVSSEIKREGSEQHREDASKYIYYLRSARFDLPNSRPVVEECQICSVEFELNNSVPVFWDPLPLEERKGTRFIRTKRDYYSKGNANILQIFRANGKRKSSNLRLVFAWEKKKRKRKKKKMEQYSASTTEQIQSFFLPHF